MEVPNIYYYLLSYASIVVYLGGAGLLFVQSRRSNAFSRPRRTLAFILLIWGLAYIPSYFAPAASPAITLNPMSIYTLILGNLFVIISLLYPLELARPGWINVQNITKLLLPYLGINTLYFSVLAVKGEPVLILSNIDELIENLGQFNVWFRFVLYASTCIYIAHLLLNTSIPALRHRRQCLGDKTPINPRLIRWLRIYGIGMVCITIAYLGLLLTGTTGIFIVHRTIALAFFTLIVCGSAFNQSQNRSVKTAPDV